jgi:3-oxoacyl-[acyl-carrier-protein] synthase-3
MNYAIAGLGSYLPSKILTNNEIEVNSRTYDRQAKQGESLDHWVRRRHGGITRHLAAAGEATSDLATQAARDALADARASIDSIDLLVLATCSSDFRLPPSAAVVQKNLGFEGKFLQIDSACTGFIDAVHTATALMATGSYGRSLVVCADVTSLWIDPDDWLTQSVFGDGAAAVVLEAMPEPAGFSHLMTGSEGSMGHLVKVDTGGSRSPWPTVQGDRGRYLNANYGRIHMWGITHMVSAVRMVLDAAEIKIDDIDWLIPHQASSRIIADAGDKLGMDPDRVIVTFPKFGNTVGSSIPLALCDAYRHGKFRPGDLLMLAAVGAGMAWGSVLYEWPDRKA